VELEIIESIDWFKIISKTLLCRVKSTKTDYILLEQNLAFLRFLMSWCLLPSCIITAILSP